MTEVETGRMLLSHNFDISNALFPELSLEEFTQVFIDGLSQYDGVKCRQLSHPHWMVEILFLNNNFSPLQVGELCADALVNKRTSQKNKDHSRMPLSYPELFCDRSEQKTSKICAIPGFETSLH